MVWRKVTTEKVKRDGGEVPMVTGPGRRIYCPEPVGPATKLNDTKITVKSNTANIEGSAENSQSVGKVYDLGDIIQYSQYATFMNCVAWANGIIDGKDYNDINSEILHDTVELIKARVSAEATATVEAKAKAIADAAAEAEKAKQEAAAAAAAAKGADAAAKPSADEKAKDLKGKEDEAGIRLKAVQELFGGAQQE